MSTPSHTTELWSANVSSWQLSWDITSSSSVVPNNCAASEVLPSQADQHLLKENMPRTSSSYFHWVTTLHATLLALWPWCGFQIIQDNCAYPGLCACCSFWMPSFSLQPLSGDTYTSSRPLGSMQPFLTPPWKNPPHLPLDLECIQNRLTSQLYAFFH